MKGVRLSRPEDLGALKEIWNASFPGDEAFADWFLKTSYRPDNALVWTDGESPAAMLHLIPMHLRIEGRDVRAAYVYAVATLPRHRGQGIAAALLEEAEALEKARGTALLMLVPQSESLFEYYRRLGFQDAFFRTRRAIEPGAAAIPAGLALDEDPDARELNACFESALDGRDHVMRTMGHWAKSLSYLKALGVRRDGRMTGYAVYDPEGTVSELIALDRESRMALEAGALPRMGVKEATAFGPDGPGEPYGMARAIAPGAEPRNGYAGLMLD